MNRNALFADTHSFVKLLFVLFISFSSFLIFFFIAKFFAYWFFGLPLFDFTSYIDISNKENIELLKFFQVVEHTGMFIIPAIIAGVLMYYQSPDYTGLRIHRIPGILPIITSVLAMIAVVPVINTLAEINSSLDLPDAVGPVEDWMKKMEDQAENITTAFLNVESIPGLLFNIFLIAVIPAIGEEFLFRGVIQRIFIDWTKNIHAGILITSICFSAFHFQFYGFIPRMALGILLGYLFVWSRSMWLPVIAHFANNAFAVLLYFFYRDEFVKKEIDSLGTSAETIHVFIMGLALSGLLFYGVFVQTKKYRKIENLRNHEL